MACDLVLARFTEGRGFRFHCLPFLQIKIEGIELSHFSYDFYIPLGSQRVCEVTKDSFLLQLHLLEWDSTFLCTPSFAVSSTTTTSLLASFPVSPGGSRWHISSTTTTEGPIWESPLGYTIFPPSEEANDYQKLVQESSPEERALGIPPDGPPLARICELSRGGSQLMRLSYSIIGGNQGNKTSSSDIDSDNISHELNEAMEIDALISDSRKRHKTVDHFLSSLRCLLSEVSTLGLRYAEARDKELTELDRGLKLYNKVREENEIINEQHGVLTESLAMMETKVEECGVELTVEKERCIIVEVELKKFTVRHSSEVEMIIRDCQEHVDTTLESRGRHWQLSSSKLSKISWAPFKGSRRTCSFIPKSPVAHLTSARSTWDSYVATWKRELFVEEWEGSGTTDLAPSAVGDIVTSVPPSVNEDVMVATPTIENAAPTD
ncbi:hypothetical protein GOBAR_AA14740 [Gossypium barbadense]|uniref:Uncharacterized protein n=1 Tax=Gossypium barbadense TaxID=3634 RepID=A0A2P5XRE3_GOSBA|nr:hypothetical protein GOBAR_AA14740 [Gossypium barbadense]